MAAGTLVMAMLLYGELYTSLIWQDQRGKKMLDFIGKREEVRLLGLVSQG